MKTNKIIFTLLAMFAIVATFSSCVKQNFDMPPSSCDSLKSLEPTFTIKQLKALYDGDTVLLGDTVTIEGYVISTDQFGNFYKKIVIQDTSAGIELEIDDSYMFTKYPVGQKVLINCKGLVLGDYKGIKELGMGYDLTNGIVRIAADSEDVYIQKICEQSVQEPKEISISDINDGMLNTLVKIKDVEFKSTDTSKTWADASGSGNRTLIDAAGHQLIVRTSNYSSFAKESVPDSSGYIIGVLGKYSTDYQLYIRDLNDVSMDSNPRF